MHLPSNLLLLAFSTLTSAIPTSKQRRDVSIASLEGLTHNARDHTDRKRGPSKKYFHESTFDSHLDGRFASASLPEAERLTHLRSLVRTYMSTMHTLGAETWIMHGSLLGWWWNRRIMPWDSDIDVQISEQGIDFLAAYYNMTVHTFKDIPNPEKSEVVVAGSAKEPKKYLLEINPHYKDGDTRDWYNVIDARWIDIDTGLFIDITTLRLNTTSPKEERTMYCKDRHKYLASQIFPLRSSVFESMPVKIPYAYQELLREEYGGRSLTKTEFKTHIFDQGKMEWVPMTAEQRRLSKEKERQEKGDEKWSLRGTKPGRKAGGGGRPEPGMVGEVHHPPGSSLE